MASESPWNHRRQMQRSTQRHRATEERLRHDPTRRDHQSHQRSRKPLRVAKACSRNESCALPGTQKTADQLSNERNGGEQGKAQKRPASRTASVLRKLGIGQSTASEVISLVGDARRCGKANVWCVCGIHLKVSRKSRCGEMHFNATRGLEGGRNRFAMLPPPGLRNPAAAAQSLKVTIRERRGAKTRYPNRMKAELPDEMSRGCDSFIRMAAVRSLPGQVTCKRVATRYTNADPQQLAGLPAKTGLPPCSS